MESVLVSRSHVLLSAETELFIFFGGGFVVMASFVITWNVCHSLQVTFAEKTIGSKVISFSDNVYYFEHTSTIYPYQICFGPYKPAKIFCKSRVVTKNSVDIDR